MSISPTTSSSADMMMSDSVEMRTNVMARHKTKKEVSLSALSDSSVGSLGSSGTTTTAAEPLRPALSRNNSNNRASPSHSHSSSSSPVKRVSIVVDSPRQEQQQQHQLPPLPSSASSPNNINNSRAFFPNHANSPVVIGGGGGSVPSSPNGSPFVLNSSSPPSSPADRDAFIRRPSNTSTTSNNGKSSNAEDHAAYDIDDLNYEEHASWSNFLLFSFLNRIFKLGNKKTLELQDLGGISNQDRTEVLYEKFVHECDFELQKPLLRQSLWKAIWRTVGYLKLLLAIALAALGAAFQFGPVNILTRLVQSFQGVIHYTSTELWIMVAFLFICPVLGSLAMAHSNVIMAHVGAAARNVLINAVYRKTLKISSFSRQTISTGQILTMFSDDTNQIRSFMMLMCTVIVAPMQIAVCLYFIYCEVGNVMFIGLGYSMFTIPMMGIVVGIVFRIRSIKISLTDRRVKLINEILSGIRIIKYYGWEGAFVKKLSELRDEEVSALMKMAFLFQSMGTFLLMASPQIQTILIFIAYISPGNQLDGAKAFTLLALFGIMLVPFTMLPVGLQQFNQSKVAMNRIIAFLREDEIKPYIVYNDIDKVEKIVVEFRNFCCSWVPESSDSIALKTKGSPDQSYEVVATSEAESAAGSISFANRAVHTLRNINLRIKQGQLVAIIGSVGSGKSSFLASLLGEMHKLSGELLIGQKHNLKGDPVHLSIAYCDQRAWIVNATLKENILFGKELDEERLSEVVYASCMDDDVDILSGGVDTEIGERGINLSGGQKARVSLARAAYSDADIYLLDDPLSAVDAHVGRHIFNECIKGILHGKTRFLVTHHVHVLPQCDLIVILEDDGTVKMSGTYEELLKVGININEFVEVENDDQDVIDQAIDEIEPLASNSLHSQSFFMKQPPRQLTGNENADLIMKEDKHEGNIDLQIVWTYIKIGGAFTFFLSVFMQVLSQVFLINSNFWLADWGEETTIDNIYYRRDMSRQRSLYWYDGYAGLVLSGVAAFIATRLIFTYHRGHVTKSIHERLLNKVLYMPITFFDVTPLGRIINRFSQDIATIDEELPMQLVQVITSGITSLGYFAGIAGATKGTLMVLAVPLGILYGQFQSIFRQPNMAIARLEAVSRSPVYADFSQTLSGATTIRAYSQQDRFIGKLAIFSNKNTVPGVIQQIASQWLAIRLDFLGALIMVFMGALAVGLRDNDFVPAKYLGLGLSYSIQLTAMLKVLIRTLATVEAQFSSIERINQYIDLEGAEGQEVILPEEDRCVTETDTLHQDVDAPEEIFSNDIEMNEKVAVTEKKIFSAPAGWPSEGRIQFDDVSMRYRDGPLVLTDVSFEVMSKDKIGIAGRTGCGKSSLMVALFRMEELACGRILIDDIDISTIPLKDLRSRLCIIPQDPVMFSASLRFNLDPFNEFSDDHVWEVIRSVNLWDHIQSLPNKLDEYVSEGGDNFSAGQRQLICMGRAILRKPKILVMDEATASIDPETDAFIQSMIREKFADCTVLTIAHRLHTIIDSTKVLVMDKGFKREFDTPDILLGNDDGLFKALWERHLKEGGESSPMMSPQKRNSLH